MGMSRKDLEPLATAIGRAMLDAGASNIHGLPEPARTLALDVRRQCWESAPNFDPQKFDAWAVEVAAGTRSPITGARIAKPRTVEVSA